MKSDLAIATLIRSRMTELGPSRGEFAKRLGYKNIAKTFAGSTPCATVISMGRNNFLDVLPQALVEDMYRPDRFGRTATGTVEVTAAR